MASNESSTSPDPSPASAPGAPAQAFTLGRLRADQADEAASVIHRSLVAYYGKHLNQGARFGNEWRPFRIFPDLYEALDPGCAVTACGPGGELQGVCFYHPRETHVSLGIVATDPESGGRGVARAMVEEALRLADEAGLPARLVSSALNLDSFSLYTRLGFVPGILFQDMQFPPGNFPPVKYGAEAGIRPARLEDAAAMADLEYSLTGIRRLKDYEFFLRAQGGLWQSFVQEDAGGKLRGFLCAIREGGTHLVGPGVMAEEESALALLTAQLRHHPDSNPVFLVPARAADLIRRLYAAGARNVELHLAQVRPVGGISTGAGAGTVAAGGSAEARPAFGGAGSLMDGDGRAKLPTAGQFLPSAVIIPTFLPESG